MYYRHVSCLTYDSYEIIHVFPYTLHASQHVQSIFVEAMEMLLEELMRVTFPQLPKEAWLNAANLNLYSEKWQSIGGEDLERPGIFGGLFGSDPTSWKTPKRSPRWVALAGE